MAFKIVVLFLAAFCTSSTLGNPTGQRFQVEKFLDMLARTFDEKVAFMDLYDALQKRLGLDPLSKLNGTGSGTPAEASSPGGVAEINANCPDAPPRPGTTVAYTNDPHTKGSRAFYECNPGYNGRSLFIQCLSGGVWSSTGSWAGCAPVNCGPTPPVVADADASVTSTTYKSVVYYSCRQGYTMDSSRNNVTCLESGQWSTPTFKCNQAPTANAGGMNMALLSSMMSAMGGGSGQGASPTQNFVWPMQFLGGQHVPGATIHQPHVPTPAPLISPPVPVPVHQAGPYGEAPSLSMLMEIRKIVSTPPASGTPSWLPKGTPPTANSLLEHLSNMNVHVPESLQSVLERNPDAMMSIAQSLGGAGGASGMPSFGGNAGMPGVNSNNNNNIMSMLGSMFPGLATPPAAPTTTPKPPTASFGGFGSPGGFQLPGHLRGLLPNGLSSAQGFKPQDLIALTSAGLGSGAGAGPRDITSLLSSMNPMAMLSPGGMGGQMGGRGRGPIDPEKMAEQREEMMMRAATAGLMKSMMGSAQQSRNGTAARNPAMDVFTLMALQNGLGGGGGGGSGMEGMNMMPMMSGSPFGSMMGLGGGGLFSNPFGGAK